VSEGEVSNGGVSNFRKRGKVEFRKIRYGETPFWRMGKREGDESGEDIEILGDMMSVVNFTRFNLVQE
jgi:hypothetical protein